MADTKKPLDDPKHMDDKVKQALGKVTDRDKELSESQKRVQEIFKNEPGANK